MMPGLNCQPAQNACSHDRCTKEEKRENNFDTVVDLGRTDEYAVLYKAIENYSKYSDHVSATREIIKKIKWGLDMEGSDSRTENC